MPVWATFSTWFAERFGPSAAGVPAGATPPVAAGEHETSQAVSKMRPIKRVFSTQYLLRVEHKTRGVRDTGDGVPPTIAETRPVLNIFRPGAGMKGLIN